MEPGDWDWLKLLEQRLKRSFSCHGHRAKAAEKSWLQLRCTDPGPTKTCLEFIRDVFFIALCILRLRRYQPIHNARTLPRELIILPRRNGGRVEGFPVLIDLDPFEKSTSSDSTASVFTCLQDELIRLNYRRINWASHFTREDNSRTAYCSPLHFDSHEFLRKIVLPLFCILLLPA